VLNRFMLIVPLITLAVHRSPTPPVKRRRHDRSADKSLWLAYLSNRCWNLFLARDQKVETAFKTPEAVFHSGAGSFGERRSHFAVNPTTWALKAFRRLRLEARKAFLQDSRGPEMRLNFSFARRYVRKLVFQIDGALPGVASNLGGKLCDFPHVGHFLSPTTSADKPQRVHHFEIERLLGLSEVRRGPGSEAITKSADTARSGRSMIFGLHFAVANELRHCRGKAVADWRKLSRHTRSA
jgi:hypothetical protein